ncbi:MAG: hypothetical protein ACMUHX_08710 [bacterium]
MPEIKNKGKTFIDALNTPFVLILAGFLFTTVAGTIINHFYHEKSWKSKARFEIFKEKFQEARETQENLLSLANQRIFFLRRIYFELSDDRLQSARDLWKEYFIIVKNWNDQVLANQNKLALLFDNHTAIAFLDDKENHSEEPKSLHHSFRKAHNAILALIECMKGTTCSSQESKDLLNEATLRMDNLGNTHDQFSALLTAKLREKEDLLLK